MPAAAQSSLTQEPSPSARAGTPREVRAWLGMVIFSTLGTAAIALLLLFGDVSQPLPFRNLAAFESCLQFRFPESSRLVLSAYKPDMFGSALGVVEMPSEAARRLLQATLTEDSRSTTDRQNVTNDHWGWGATGRRDPRWDPDHARDFVSGASSGRAVMLVSFDDPARAVAYIMWNTED